MNWKKMGKRFLFPPIAIPLLLLPLAVGGMLWGMHSLGENHPVTIAAYGLAFYGLTIFCLRIPAYLRYFRAFREGNRYTSLWFGDPRLRMNVILTANVVWNGAYGALQLGLAIRYQSAWFYSLAAYYACLAAMRFFLVRHSLGHEPGKMQKQELKYYRSCGWIFLILNLALSGMMYFMIREDGATPHGEITTIAMATYTFTTLALAIVNLLRYRKWGSPVVSAARAVSLTAACVSMLSLENTMLATFGDGGTRGIFLILSGGGVSIFILTMAIYMIVNANRKLTTTQ